MGHNEPADEGPPGGHAGRLARWDAAPRPIVTPSLLACDFAVMRDELRALEAGEVVGVHLDVMDGHFVPNLSYGAPVIASWRRHTGMFFDAHLMMSDPGRYLDDFARAGCDQLTFHIEAVPEPGDLLSRIRAAGLRAGLALNPPTPIEFVLPHLDNLDSVLVMSVMPGFGGQAFDPSVLPKVRAIRMNAPTLPVAIDGGINPTTAGVAAEAGVTQLVAGSSVFLGGGGYSAALLALTRAARLGAANGVARPGEAAP